MPLEDAEQMEEVELLSTVMIEAGATEGNLDQHEVDRLLGVDQDAESEPPDGQQEAGR